MLQNIDIKNFRCFKDTQISGFERVNLIGGKNNSGKTMLLEALAVYHIPKAGTVAAIRTIRNESAEIAKAIPERTWNHLFFNQNKLEEIEIICKDIDKRINIQNIEPSDLDTIKDSMNSEDLLNLISQNKPISILKVVVLENSKKIESLVIGESDNFYTFDIKEKIDLPLIPSFARISNKYIAEEYDKARLEDREKEVLKIIQILDPSIATIETFTIGEPTIYLTRNSQKRLPFSLFGDAINRATYIVLKLINNQTKFLLIDEVENGIHYTNQRDFWKMLFRLAIELDTQIFATTHSWEMIRAFADVGVEHYPNMGAYFELAQKPNSDRIVGIKRDMETLEYAIAHGKNIRGE